MNAVIDLPKNDKFVSRRISGDLFEISFNPRKEYTEGRDKNTELDSRVWDTLSGEAKNSKWISSKQNVEGPGLRDHFTKHGDEVGAKSAREYDLSSRKTIENGKKFKYRDPSSNEPRIGYWDESTGLFTATSQTRGSVTIVTHFPLSWEKIRKLPGFTNF